MQKQHCIAYLLITEQEWCVFQQRRELHCSWPTLCRMFHPWWICGKSSRKNKETGMFILDVSLVIFTVRNSW